MTEALRLFVEADDSFVEKRQNRRKIDDRKDAPKNPHSSCFRKGYHKYNRDWKNASRKKRRNCDKMALHRGNIPYSEGDYLHYNRWLETPINDNSPIFEELFDDTASQIWEDYCKVTR